MDKKRSIKESYYEKIALAWGHSKTSPKEYLINMGSGLYNRYCLQTDYSQSAIDYPQMKKLCEELKQKEAE